VCALRHGPSVRVENCFATFVLRTARSVTITMQFRDWGGMFMEHCHNTTHEDNSMLLRWEIDDAGGAFLKPLPTPIAKVTGVTYEEDPFEILP